MTGARTPTHYDVLDVDPHAETDVIHVAWRHMATLVHPDAALEHSDPEEYADRESMMKTVNAAWETLGNPTRRAAYDNAIGLDRPLTRLALRLRRATRAAQRPRESTPLRLHRPSLLSRPPLFAEAAALGRFTWGTRLGQWLLILAVAALGQMIGSLLDPGLRGPATLGMVLLVGIILAHGGEPTPAADAARGFLWATRNGARVGAAMLRRIGHEILVVLATRGQPSTLPPASPEPRER